jgi:hypothetical protein
MRYMGWVFAWNWCLSRTLAVYHVNSGDIAYVQLYNNTFLTHRNVTVHFTPHLLPEQRFYTT